MQRRRNGGRPRRDDGMDAALERRFGTGGASGIAAERFQRSSARLGGMSDVARREHTAFPFGVGRYTVFEPFASGGMATVHPGLFSGPAGFSRQVAIKRLRPQFTGDPQFVSMFLDEARLAARIHHPNVVSTLDVIEADDELLLVMDLVEGVPLS